MLKVITKEVFWSWSMVVVWIHKKVDGDSFKMFSLWDSTQR